MASVLRICRLNREPTSRASRHKRLPDAEYSPPSSSCPWEDSSNWSVQYLETDILGNIILKNVGEVSLKNYHWGVFLYCSGHAGLAQSKSSIPFLSIKFSCGQYASACAAVTRITFFITCLLYQNTICREIDFKCIPNLNGEHMFRYTSKHL